MKSINIHNRLKFTRAAKNLETLQAFKVPLVQTFEKLICGNPTISEDAEFCYIKPIEDEYSDERPGMLQDVEKFIKETEADENNIAELFYKLSGLLEKYENEQKVELMRACELVE